MGEAPCEFAETCSLSHAEPLQFCWLLGIPCHILFPSPQHNRLPSFLYAMPLSATSVFLEETSLVARPIIPFEDLKVRLEARLKYLGLEVRGRWVLGGMKVFSVW